MVTIIALLIVLVAIFVGVGIVLYRRQVRQSGDGNKTSPLPFRWQYILLPAIFLIISVILTIYFSGKLPFQIAYHFESDGTPDQWAIKQFFIAIALGIQFILLLISFFIVMGVRRNRFFTSTNEAGIKPETMITLMGNLPALIQLILLFEMGDVFSYNALHRHIFPQWLFLIIFLVLATAAFIAFLIIIGLKAIRQSKM